MQIYKKVYKQERQKEEFLFLLNIAYYVQHINKSPASQCNLATEVLKNRYY